MSDSAGAVLTLTGPLWQEPPCILPDSVELRPDIVFARPAGRELALDLFLPRKRERWAPGMVFLYGGGWQQGNRQQFWRHAIHLATLGVVSICSSYRHAPAFTFPAQLEDAQASVRWLRGHAEELGVDPARIGAAGGSAGGHLAALLGTAEAVVAGLSSKVQVVAAFNPVLDLTSVDSDDASDAVRGLLGGDMDLAKAASPYWRADATAAPALILHGTADAVAPFRQAKRYRERLHELGVRAELFAADGAAHGFFNRPQYYQPTLERMTSFALSVLDARVPQTGPST